MTRGSKRQILAGARRIGVSVAHVPLLSGFALNGDRPAGHARNQLEHMVQRDARATANIVHAARTRPCRPAAIVAATMSLTNVKSRVCSPSP